MSWYSEVFGEPPDFYFRLNEASGNATDEMSAATMTLSGVTYQVDGAIASDPGDKAISFDGINDTGVFGTSSYTNSILTLEFWAKIDAYTDAGELVLTMNPAGALGNRFYIDADSPSGVVEFAMMTTAGQFWADSFTRPSTGVWHHWVCVHDRATPVNKVYIDGVSQSLTTVLHDAASYGNFVDPTFYLMHNGDGTGWLAGDVDEFVVYGYELSAARALAHYNAAALADAVIFYLQA